MIYLQSECQGFCQPKMGKIVMWYYGQRVKKSWHKKDWPAVIAIYEQFKQQNLQIKETTQLELNVSAAYQNQSLTFVRKGQWRGAAEVLLQCIEKVPLALTCMKRLKKLNSEHTIFESVD